MSDRAPVGVALLIVSSLVWLGLLVGVSFLATPAKFLAPSLSLPVALEVGRHTFGVFSYVEIGAAIVVLACAWAVAQGRFVIACAAALAALVALQAGWLLPVLDARVETIMRGGMPEAARFHELYVGLELLKAGLLGYLAWRGLGAHARRALPMQVIHPEPDADAKRAG